MAEIPRRSFLEAAALVAAGSAGPFRDAVASALAGSAMTENNKRLAREYYAVLDKDGPDAGGGYDAPNFAYHGANHTGFAHLTAAEQGRAFYKAFPDFTHVILEQIADGDIVVERIRYFATHRDTFMGIPATGRRITFTGMDWVRFEQGKVAERWGVADELDLRRQLLGEPDPRAAGGNGTL